MGVLMCGLSTGYFFVVLSRIYQSRLAKASCWTQLWCGLYTFFFPSF